MARRKQPHIPDQLLDQLLAGTDAKAAFAKDGLLDELKKHDIDDRRNELSGNVSLNQELSFIQAVNEWVREDKERTGFAKTHKEIDIYMITMAKQLTDSLDLGSKFNRDPAFVADLRQHGEERGAEFLDFWSTAEEHELEIIKWPNSCPGGHPRVQEPAHSPASAGVAGNFQGTHCLTSGPGRETARVATLTRARREGER